jgi:hypothetical protein
MFLQEIVINVHKCQLGGTGSPLLGGFQPSGIIQDGWKRHGGTAEEKDWEFCQDESSPDRPGWTKEIMIAGHGRSAWGEFSVNGQGVAGSKRGMYGQLFESAGVPVVES